MIEPKLIYVDKRSIGSELLDEVLEKFPHAETKPVDSHWRIPELHQNEDLLTKWAYVKRHYLVIGHKVKYTYQANGRSTDFIGPSVANGCALACSYCVEEGTLISTPTGNVPVEKIEEDSLVLSYDSYSKQLVSARVQAVASRHVEEVYELEVDGKTLVVTGEHPILTRRGWVEAQYLTCDDEVLCE